MMISTKGRYALRVLVDLAEHYNGSYIPMKEITERQSVSEKYLEAIARILVKADIIKGIRGKNGGYCLTRDPSEITVAEVLVATEGTLAPVACLNDSKNTCPRLAECRTINMWSGLDNAINEYLSNYKLSDLMQQHIPD